MQICRREIRRRCASGPRLFWRRLSGDLADAREIPFPVGSFQQRDLGPLQLEFGHIQLFREDEWHEFHANLQRLRCDEGLLAEGGVVRYGYVVSYDAAG